MRKGDYFLRRIILLSFCVLLCPLLAACGQQTGEYEVGSAELEYYDIASEKNVLFEETEEEGYSAFLGMQYFEGEPIQLRMSFDEEGEGTVRLCRADGSREVLIEGVQAADRSRWYMDEAGCFYCWKRSWDMDIEGEGAPYIRKLDGSGVELFYKELDQGTLLWDFCQMGDGSILLLLQEGRGGDMKLAELNPKTGAVSEKGGVRLGQSADSKYIAAGSQGVLMLETGSSEGVSEISMEDGSVFFAQSFLGTSYSIEEGSEGMEVQDFRALEDGAVEILWRDPAGDRGVREILRLSKMEKIPIVLQAAYVMGDVEWFQRRIGEFNQINSKYQVILERPDGTSTVNRGEMVAIQMATGGGPDILYGYALDWVYGLIEKGGFEDLAPYMEESGIHEEDYFPYAFSCWRDGEKIYTFRVDATPYSICLNKEILEGRDVSDVETLLDAMLDWEGDNHMNYGATSRGVLEYFFHSEDFWGMVDWEEGTCDFGGDVFAKLLKTAKKYGLPWEKAVAGDYEILPPAARAIDCTLVRFKTSEELEKMGLVSVNPLLDGAGASMATTASAFAINANSLNKEGAWEFIRYMMSEGVQLQLADFEERTNKAAHMAGMERVLERLNSEEGATIGGQKELNLQIKGETIVEYEAVYTKEDMTQERIDEYLGMLENAAENTDIAYMRLLPIYEIIKEEAEYYFADEKSLEEVVDIISRRVGLYVGEQH